MRVKLEVRNFAKIEFEEIYLDDFVLFVGDNNSGKTLTMELIYGVVNLLCSWKSNVTSVKRTMIDDITYYGFGDIWFSDLEKEINNFFKVNKVEFVINCFSKIIPLESIMIRFEDTKDYSYIYSISDTISLEKKYPDEHRELLMQDESIPNAGIDDYLVQNILKDILSIDLHERQLFVPASRAGLQMLYRYYFALPKASTEFPLAIYEFLQFLQTYSSKSILLDEENEIVQFVEQNILGGTVAFENNEFVYKDGANVMPINYASSMIHELSSITNVYKSSEAIGMIYYDEVENSVNPIKQGDVARALIRMCNNGKKVIASTHSDTMASKINNLMLLSKMKNIEKKNDKLEKLNLEVKDMLDNDKKIIVYEFKKAENGKVRVNALDFITYPKIGYSFERFNENIDNLYEEASCITE